MSLKRADIKITGVVQGVYYRHTAKQKAEELGITGWARNELDGSVRIMAEGEEDNLQKFIEWCRKGSMGSRVNSVEIEWREATGELNNFEIN